MNLFDFITVEKIINPKTEQEIEVLAIRFSDEHLKKVQGKEHLNVLYIDPITGDIFSRNFMNDDWNLWIPIPFLKKLHERLNESGYKYRNGVYRPEGQPKLPGDKQVALEDLPQEQQERLLKMLGKLR